jgi:hypothetical protein
MGDEPAAASLSSQLVAGPVWAPGLEDLARLRAVSGKARAAIHSQLRGVSMGSAIPDGARIRIRSGPDDMWHAGQAIAFLAGSRVMVHRIVYEGRRGPAQHFVLTQGDGNWLCDPPVNRSTVVGEVEAFSSGGEWQSVPAPRIRLHRRLAARPWLLLMQLALECNPTFAIWISRPISWLRMVPTGVLLKLRRCCAGHVRH